MSEPLYTFPALTEADITAVKGALTTLTDSNLANLATLATGESPLYGLIGEEMERRGYEDRKLADEARDRRRELYAGRALLRGEIRLQWDSGDIKASALSPEFDLCEVMTFLEIDVPPEVGYSQGWIGEPDSEWSQDLILWHAGDLIDGDDMIYWVRVLDRYMDVCVRGTERDY
jgi:hypothetical protein